MSSPRIPSFDDLPAVKGMPQGCAWGIFDKDGKKDVYGCLNLLTPDVVKEAAKEVREGISVSVNWPINGITKPGFGRKGLVHKIIDFKESPMGAYGFDDEIEFNTQCSSQWDSFCHFNHQPTGTSYNGHRADTATLHDPAQTLPTLNHWHSRGGLVARGVLIDYKRHAARHGKSYSPFEAHRITISEIEEIAQEQGVRFKQGDVIIIRSGFTEALTGMTGEEQGKAMAGGRAVGVEGTRAAAKWFWNQHFAAVAGDAIAFEALPPVLEDQGGEEGVITDLVLHPYFLSLFGLPIGELWDLRRLSEECKRLGRWTFMLTSCPLNVPGSIGSPPNALAVF